MVLRGRFVHANVLPLGGGAYMAARNSQRVAPGMSSFLMTEVLPPAETSQTVQLPSLPHTDTCKSPAVGCTGEARIMQSDRRHLSPPSMGGGGGEARNREGSGSL